MARLCALVLAAFAVFAPIRGMAADIDAATTAAIQSVITRQLDAIKRDDGAAAEAFAAPGIKARFPGPAVFLAMVRAHYAPLINPRSTTFGEVTASPHGPVQRMTVVASDGTVWMAVYTFEKVENDWRITACGLVKDASQRDI